MLCDLTRGEVEQLCVVVQAPTLNRHDRPKGMEPKSAREERFAAQSCEELGKSKNPVLALARELSDVFLVTTPAVLPADRGVQQKIDLVPGS